MKVRIDFRRIHQQFMRLSRPQRSSDASRDAEPSDPTPPVAPPTALAALGVEVWRLGRRADAAPEQGDRFRDAHSRLVRALEDAGVRIDDPLGREFVEGTTADIIDMPEGLNPAEDRLVVANVLRPAVYVAGRCVISPQIVVGRQNSEEVA